MSNVDVLINIISDNLGVDPAVAKKSVGAIVAFCQEQAKDFDFSKVFATIGGLESLVNSKETREIVGDGNTARSESVGGTEGILGLLFSVLGTAGIMGLLKQIIGAIFGENVAKMLDSVGDGAQLMDLLSKMGIDQQKAIKIVATTIDFLKDNVDPDTIKALIEKVPALKAILGK